MTAPPTFQRRLLDSLPGDADTAPVAREVVGACWSRVQPTPVAAPKMLHWSPGLAAELGDVSGHDVYLSGSPGMVYACVDVLASLGLDPSRVFSDVFAYAPRDPLVPVVGSLVGEKQS